MASQESSQLSYSTPQWWKEAIVYQIYPSSFQSHAGNTTGWGSIKGITSRLDYLKQLGVDVIWTSPFFKSPQVDMGYDIADYKDVDSRYGTLDDVDTLIAELRKRDMKLMVDLVVNHTSDQHPWFLESRSSKDNPKRDWYIWKKPRGDGAPPNNWASILGEAHSAWTYDETTGEYYFSLFTPEQPDLNWENPDVRAAVWDVMHFWMQRGAAGFRLDVINLISKVTTYPDAEILLDPKYHKYQPAFKYVVNGPKLHDYLREMNSEVLSRYGLFSWLSLRLDAITVGEMPWVNDENEILRTVGADAGELRMIFIFDLVDIDKPAIRMAFKPWDLKAMRAVITRWQRVMIERNGWNAVFIENHDNPRSISHFADDSDKYRHISAKLLALMQTTLGGTLFVYQGEEIGMRNIPKEWDIAKEYKDVETQNYWNKVNAVWGDTPELLQHGRAVVECKARDHARTPMQWDASANAGFCDPGVAPWMRVMDDYETINAEAQMRSDDGNYDESVWQFWKAGIRRRKEHANVFVYGDFEEVTPDHPNTFAYTRTSRDGKGEKWLVLMNFFGRQTEWIVPADLKVEAWVCGNYSKGEVLKPLEGMVPLRPWEGLLAKLCVPGTEVVVDTVEVDGQTVTTSQCDLVPSQRQSRNARHARPVLSARNRNLCGAPCTTYCNGGTGGPDPYGTSNPLHNCSALAAAHNDGGGFNIAPHSIQYISMASCRAWIVNNSDEDQYYCSDQNNYAGVINYLAFNCQASTGGGPYDGGSCHFYDNPYIGYVEVGTS
ncbi:glycoside hydrolase superfamily [Xylaria scruposa]|nr:glycoside hydrolase superfamily [Xylaria scruposa]